MERSPDSKTCLPRVCMSREVVGIGFGPSTAPSGGIEPPTPGFGTPSKGSEDEGESPETES